jgi:hypothetical protein
VRTFSSAVVSTASFIPAESSDDDQDRGGQRHEYPYDSNNGVYRQMHSKWAAKLRPEERSSCLLYSFSQSGRILPILAAHCDIILDSAR